MGTKVDTEVAGAGQEQLGVEQVSIEADKLKESLFYSRQKHTHN